MHSLGLRFVGNSTVRLELAGRVVLTDPVLADRAGVDIALLPVWGWGATLGPGHLTPARAAAGSDVPLGNRG